MTTTDVMIDDLRVEEIFEACGREHSPERRYVDGPVIQHSLSKVMLEHHRYTIGRMLMQLPEQFQSRKGVSLTYAAIDRNGRVWNSQRPSAPEKLMLLGDALDLIEITKEFDPQFGGRSEEGQPHFRVLVDKINDNS